MNVYFVNCLLACLLASIVGYWMGKRTTERRMSDVLARLISSGSIKATVVGSDSPSNATKH